MLFWFMSVTFLTLNKFCFSTTVQFNKLHNSRTYEDELIKVTGPTTNKQREKSVEKQYCKTIIYFYPLCKVEKKNLI